MEVFIAMMDRSVKSNGGNLAARVVQRRTVPCWHGEKKKDKENTCELASLS
jgi:hypothetical protein